MTRPNRERRGAAVDGGARVVVAVALALAVHGVVVVAITQRAVRAVFPPSTRDAVAVTLLTPPPPPPPPSPPPPPPPSPPTTTTSRPARTEPPPPVAAALPPPPAEPAPTTTPARPTTSSPPSLLRLPQPLGTLDGMLALASAGAGTPGVSRAALEGALDLKVDGPLRDDERAARTATQALQDDLADDAVSAGLADDYFRALRREVEIAWKPEVQQLNDGGASTTQVGMLRGFVEERGAWGELWKAYLDLAKQYGNGQAPTLEPARRERLRELMRSRKGAFRVHAITELKLTQDASGRVLLLELPLPSGHPRIDDGLRDAIERAIAAMPSPPPERLSHGRSFTSWWRLRATWTMVPPTALLTGAGFDITAKGFTVDVPFEIKRSTHVLLQRTDAKTSAAGDPE